MWGCKQSQCCLPGMCSWLWFGPCSEPQGPWGKKKETIWLRGKKEAANTRPLSTAAAAASETCHGRTGQFFCVSCSFPTKTCTKALPCVVKEITDTGQEGDSANKLWDGDKVGSQGCLVLKSSPPLSLWVKRTEGKGNAVSKELAGKLFEASRETSGTATLTHWDVWLSARARHWGGCSLGVGKRHMQTSIWNM